MICPRCDFQDASKVFEAEDGAWEIYGCSRCGFNWRSTEEAEITDPRRYDPRFKLSEKAIAAMTPKPPLPPLKKKG